MTSQRMEKINQPGGITMKSKYSFVSRDGYETEILVELDSNGHETNTIRIQGMLNQEVSK